MPMRPTKLVAGSSESFSDAARKLINKAIALSGSIKCLRIVEDQPISESSFPYNLKAHVLKRKAVS